jgi:hypothetical protein
LDEILPASKQKKLILPSINLRPSSDGRSPRVSTDSRGPNSGQVGKLKTAHDSSASLDSSASGAARRSKRKTGASGTGGKESPIQPDFDASEAMRLGQTTEIRLEGMSDEELQHHVRHLVQTVERAKEVLGFWESRREEAGREKEAFEGVIENLVSFARKRR